MVQIYHERDRDRRGGDRQKRARARERDGERGKYRKIETDR